jgi:hypothetical protein
MTFASADRAPRMGRLTVPSSVPPATMTTTITDDRRRRHSRRSVHGGLQATAAARRTPDDIWEWNRTSESYP